jgi:dipeptidyl aminopeptidase/acylaminoacyl peptidase
VALLGGKPDEHPEKARQASPLYNVDPDDPPFLIVHGTSDPIVPYAASVDLDAALRSAGVPVVFQTIEGGGHGDFYSAEIVRRVRAFLERSFYDPKVEVPAAPIVFAGSGG